MCKKNIKTSKKEEKLRKMNKKRVKMDKKGQKKRKIDKIEIY